MNPLQKKKAEKENWGWVVYLRQETSYNSNGEEADPCVQNGKTIIYSPSH